MVSNSVTGSSQIFEQNSLFHALFLHFKYGIKLIIYSKKVHFLQINDNLKLTRKFSAILDFSVTYIPMFQHFSKPCSSHQS